MDTTSLIIIGLLVVGAIISLVFGIKFLIKYNLTRKKLHLILGILLTFVVPAVLLFLAFSFWRYYPGSAILYGPSPMMEYGPGPA